MYKYILYLFFYLLGKVRKFTKGQMKDALYVGVNFGCRKFCLSYSLRVD